MPVIVVDILDDLIDSLRCSDDTPKFRYYSISLRSSTLNDTRTIIRQFNQGLHNSSSHFLI